MNRQCLLAIVDLLRKQTNTIATELVQKGYFGGYFQVSRKIGKPLKGYYTPFHAEPFGSIAEMEQAKPKMIQDIIKVEPYINRPNES